MSTIEVFTDHLTLTTDKEPIAVKAEDKGKEESSEEPKENN